MKICLKKSMPRLTYAASVRVVHVLPSLFRHSAFRLILIKIHWLVIRGKMLVFYTDVPTRIFDVNPCLLSLFLTFFFFLSYCFSSFSHLSLSLTPSLFLYHFISLYLSIAFLIVNSEWNKTTKWINVNVEVKNKGN